MAIMDESSRAQNRPFTSQPPEAKIADSTTQLPAVTSELVANSLSQYSVYFAAVPVIALLVVAVISLVVHLLVRRYRASYTHSLMPVYHFDPNDETGWESELLEDVDPPFVRDNQRPIVKGSLSIESNGGTDRNALRV